MKFEDNYFNYLKYSRKEKLISHHVYESLKWASKSLHADLLNGEGKTALDVGCAFGYGVNVLRSLGYDAWGTDVSRYALMQGKKKLNDNVFVACDSQKNFPFRKEFDLVTCFEVLEHLENPTAALQNMFDWSNNVILCTTPNKSVERIGKRLLWGYDKTHVNVKTPKEWEDLIGKTLKCRFIKTQCFVNSSFRIASKSFYKSSKFRFGMEARILIGK